MRVICMWIDLAEFGIVLVTTTRSPSSRRYPFDVTAAGKKVLESAFDVQELVLREPCHPGRPENPHVGSIMLSEGMLPFLALYSLISDGAIEVFITKDGRISGFYPWDRPLQRTMFLRYFGDDIVWHTECDRAHIGRLTDFGKDSRPG